MNEQNLLEKIAFNTFMYDYYTKQGWSNDWCKFAFEVDYCDEKTKHIEMAKIALDTIKDYRK